VSGGRPEEKRKKGARRESLEGELRTENTELCSGKNHTDCEVTKILEKEKAPLVGATEPGVGCGDGEVKKVSSGG